VYSGNQIILRKDRIQYSVGSRCSDISVSKKKIAVECIGASIIDTKIRIGGKVVFGTIAFVNNDKSPENITWAVFVDGDKVEQNVLVLLPSMTVQKEITIAPHYLQKENTYDATIRVVVFDSGSSPLFDRSFVSTVMSKYDLNLRDLNKQTADLVNPHLEEIKRFVVSGDGQLAKAMGDNFIVCGYQDPKMVYPQLKALYNAVRDYGMSYVSDVITTESGYQRVRDPVTVLRDHSGNCIELSILFASMLESMGFRTIIVFPEGHAVVGVVMRIDGNALAKQLNIELENKVIDLRINGNMIGAVFFESTNCRDSSSRFEKAVDVATSIVSIQKRFIESNGRISISNSLQR
jgi:hypothetical protein